MHSVIVDSIDLIYVCLQSLDKNKQTEILDITKLRCISDGAFCLTACMLQPMFTVSESSWVNTALNMSLR